MVILVSMTTNLLLINSVNKTIRIIKIQDLKHIQLPLAFKELPSLFINLDRYLNVCLDTYTDVLI